ncbi:MAG: 23S rRNA (guanosine(2251)-2'-O)-methyltransferase RlmB [Flammeovirgaceae bacterium]
MAFHQTKRRSSAPENMLYGIKPLEEAFMAGKTVDKVYLQRNLKSEDILALTKLAQDHKVPISKVPIEKLNRFTRKNHQGVVAFLSAITYSTTEFVMNEVYEKGENPLILVLDRVTDVRNFGAIARTAECLGVHAIVVPLRESAQIGPDAIKTSAGALNHIPVCREESLKDIIQYLQDYGLRVVGCTEKGADLIYESNFTLPTAIVMGSEENGISDEIIRMADQLCKIPMSGKVSSLNVSVATGMILSEVVRQRSI